MLLQHLPVVELRKTISVSICLWKVCFFTYSCLLLFFFFFSFFLPQDRATFRRLIVKNNAKKRKMYETFIESVPLLKTLEVSLGCELLSQSQISHCQIETL